VDRRRRGRRRLGVVTFWAGGRDRVVLLAFAIGGRGGVGQGRRT
jgi:hypothetical protein